MQVRQWLAIGVDPNIADFEDPDEAETPLLRAATYDRSEVNVCACVSVCACVRVCFIVYSCFCACVRAQRDSSHKHAYTHTHTHTRTHARARARTHTHTHTHACVRANWVLWGCLLARSAGIKIKTQLSKTHLSKIHLSTFTAPCPCLAQTWGYTLTNTLVEHLPDTRISDHTTN